MLTQQTQHDVFSDSLQCRLRRRIEVACSFHTKRLHGWHCVSALTYFQFNVPAQGTRYLCFTRTSQSAPPPVKGEAAGGVKSNNPILNLPLEDKGKEQKKTSLFQSIYCPILQRKQSITAAEVTALSAMRPSKVMHQCPAFSWRLPKGVCSTLHAPTHPTGICDNQCGLGAPFRSFPTSEIRPLVALPIKHTLPARSSFHKLQRRRRAALSPLAFWLAQRMSKGRFQKNQRFHEWSLRLVTPCLDSFPIA